MPSLSSSGCPPLHTRQADLWAAGYAITAPGGHGTQYGFLVPTVDVGTDIDAFIAARVGEAAISSR